MIASAFTTLWLASLVVVSVGLLRILFQTAVGGWLLLAEARGGALARRGSCARRSARAAVPALPAARYPARGRPEPESRAVA